MANPTYGTGMMGYTVGTRDGDQPVVDVLQYVRDVLDGSEDAPNRPHPSRAVDGETKFLPINLSGH